MQDKNGFYNMGQVLFITTLPNGKARLHFAGNGFADTDTEFADAVKAASPVAPTATVAEPISHG